jgi:hypothetical protein
MTQYIFYLRTKEGDVQRLSNIIVAPISLMGTYEYEESITGFPELVVRWANKTGCSVGIANLKDSVSDTSKNLDNSELL